MSQGVMIIAEQRDGDVCKISYELISEGRRLADYDAAACSPFYA